MFKKIIFIAISLSTLFAYNAHAQSSLFGSSQQPSNMTDPLADIPNTTILTPPDFTTQVTTMTTQNHTDFTNTLNRNISQATSQAPQCQGESGSGAGAGNTGTPTSPATSGGSTTPSASTGGATQTTAPAAATSGQYSSTPSSTSQPYTGFSGQKQPANTSRQPSGSNWNIYGH